MDYLILGLLILSPMSGYELQQFVRQNLALICSPSAGSIQTALAKLCKAGKIRWKETCQGRRRKKIYFITEAGQHDFHVWVSQPMQADKSKKMELSRLFFLGLADPQARIHSIAAYIHQIEETKTILSALREKFQQMQTQRIAQTSNLLQVSKFQKYTIEYGIAAAEFELGWYRRLLRELEEKK